MPEVISDTSPIQYLYQTRSLDLLRILYGEIIVPTGVVEEIAAGHAIGIALPHLESLEWIRIVPAPHQRILPLAVDLGRGERDVLALCSERPDSLAILDDALARRYARHLGIAFTGTLGILLRAKKTGHLDTVRAKIDQLDELGFRLDPATRISVIHLAGED